jgi:hypothetical protein
MVKRHYEESILKYSNKTAKDLFEENHIDDESDWTSILNNFCYINTLFFKDPHLT